MSTGPGRERSWKAELRLGFAHDGQRTVLADMEFRGPLRVQRPFYPEGLPCHCYVLHPPGGLVSGDMLYLEADVRPAAHALLTTPSAGKVYGTDSHNVAQGQDVRMRVTDGILEWLPMETIIFDRARAVMNLELDLAGQSRALGWDIVCLGREAGNHPFMAGQLRQQLRIRRDGYPLLLERLELNAGETMQSAPFGLGGHTVSGTMFAASPTPDLTDLAAPVRERLRPRHGMIGVTCRRGVLLVRYLGNRADEARELFESAWRIIRPALLEVEACAPRVWAT